MISIYELNENNELCVGMEFIYSDGRKYCVITNKLPFGHTCKYTDQRFAEFPGLIHRDYTTEEFKNIILSPDSYERYMFKKNFRSILK